jgi:hypothetical protein
MALIAAAAPPQRGPTIASATAGEDAGADATNAAMTPATPANSAALAQVGVGNDRVARGMASSGDG